MRTRVVRLVMALLFAVASPGPVAAANGPEILAEARRLYNAGEYAAAVKAADAAAAQDPLLADDADLIGARAYLERFRESGWIMDLNQARERLGRIQPASFGGRERAEYVVGLGQALYFEGSMGAAALLFASALDAVEGVTPDGRERVLDWWASAIDRIARARPEIERDGVYQRVLDRMTAELAERPSSAVAPYWIVAAAAGQAEWHDAWEGAKAAWVRAPLTADGGAALRADIDRLTAHLIIPERAKALAASPETLRLEWESFKEQWSR